VCGVIGIVSDEPVINDIVLGLHSLQHRGQDAAGIAVFDKQSFYIKKGLGLTADIFNAKELSTIHGTVGVGHTRYPTAGTITEQDAHPFVVDATRQLALVHNGNITNYLEIKEQLRKQGIFCESKTDAEIMSKKLAHYLELSTDIFHAVQQIMDTMHGSFSVVVALDNIGILAFRDPYGFRPLIIGKKENAYCIASETVAFESLGYKRIRDIQPGEAVFIDKKLNVVSRILKEKPIAHCMFEWVYFARPDSMLDGRSVYNARLKLGRQLAKKWDKEIDVVIPVPDSSRTAAIAFAEKLGVRYREGLIKNRYMGRTFIMPNQKTRERSVSIKLHPIMASVNGRKVALLDDSIVRGTTSQRIIAMLRRAGAKEVHFVVTCPPITHPCHYGIDFATKDELIAANKSVEEIRKEIGADSLTYQNVEDLKISCKKTTLCTACLTGEYPSPISVKQMDKLAKSRVRIREI
jgi:amidophosphoribosyltransferase